MWTSICHCSSVSTLTRQPKETLCYFHTPSRVSQLALAHSDASGWNVLSCLLAAWRGRIQSPSCGFKARLHHLLLWDFEKGIRACGCLFALIPTPFVTPDLLCSESHSCMSQTLGSASGRHQWATGREEKGEVRVCSFCSHYCGSLGSSCPRQACCGFSFLKWKEKGRIPRMLGKSTSSYASSSRMYSLQGSLMWANTLSF